MGIIDANKEGEQLFCDNPRKLNKEISNYDPIKIEIINNELLIEIDSEKYTYSKGINSIQPKKENEFYYKKLETLQNEVITKNNMDLYNSFKYMIL